MEQATTLSEYRLNDNKPKKIGHTNEEAICFRTLEMKTVKIFWVRKRNK